LQKQVLKSFLDGRAIIFEVASSDVAH